MVVPVGRIVVSVVAAVMLTWALAGAGFARPADPPARAPMPARPVLGHRGLDRIGAPAAVTSDRQAPALSDEVRTPVRAVAAPTRTPVSVLVAAAFALTVSVGALWLALVSRAAP